MEDRFNFPEPDQPEQKSASRGKKLEVAWKNEPDKEDSRITATTEGNLSAEWMLKNSLYEKMMGERDQIDRNLEALTHQKIAITQRLHDSASLELTLQEKFSRLSKKYGELTSTPTITPEITSEIEKVDTSIREIMSEMNEAKSQTEAIIAVRDEAEDKVRDLCNRQFELTQKFFPSESTLEKN